MKILISACLMGVCCRYDGGAQPCPGVVALAGEHTLVPVCPEQAGGLATPRPSAERRDGRVVTRDGEDVTGAFWSGADKTLNLCRREGCLCAILKQRSPSCGSGTIYDGSFTGKRIPGWGVAAAMLRDAGIPVFSEENLPAPEDIAALQGGTGRQPLPPSPPE